MASKRSPTSHRTPEQARTHAKTYKKTARVKKDDAQRHRARRAMVKSGKANPGDGKDVDHKRPISKGGSNGKKNLRMTSPKSNRGHGTSPGGHKKGTRRK
jgi:hypothetical protein